MPSQGIEAYTSVDRRLLLKAGLATASATALGSPPAFAALPSLAPASGLLDHSRRLIGLLDPGQRKLASFPFGGKPWQSWNYYGSTGNIKPGVRLEQMSAAQKAAAWDLLGTILSPVGLEKARNVMKLQDVLLERGDGRGQRSSERFSFAFFGHPAEKGQWGFRLEGHHLTLSVAVDANSIVSVTPSSFSVNPNRVATGKYAPLVTLKAEESLARRLFADLTPTHAGRARQSARPIDNILSDAGSERTNRGKAGMPLAELTSGQRDLVWELVETYAVEHLAEPLATSQRKRVRIGDAEAVHFAWYGPNTPEQGFGYRIIADNFVIELASVDAAAQHLHTIYHDLGNLLGSPSDPVTPPPRVRGAMRGVR